MTPDVHPTPSALSALIQKVAVPKVPPVMTFTTTPMSLPVPKPAAPPPAAHLIKRSTGLFGEAYWSCACGEHGPGSGATHRLAVFRGTMLQITKAFEQVTTAVTDAMQDFVARLNAVLSRVVALNYPYPYIHHDAFSYCECEIHSTLGAYSNVCNFTSSPVILRRAAIVAAFARVGIHATHRETTVDNPAGGWPEMRTCWALRPLAPFTHPEKAYLDSIGRPVSPAAADAITHYAADYIHALAAWGVIKPALLARYSKPITPSILSAADHVPW